ncbi:MAG: hypothetical protein ACOYNO_15335 [Saprospiraceae bacterium]
MEHSVLWQSFSALTNLERKHLGYWLASPFFCRRPQPLRLFEYLQTCVQQAQTPDQDVAQTTTGAADAQAMRLLMSELLSHLEHFMVYQEKFEPATDYHIHLAAGYRKRGLEKHFTRALRAARKDWAQQPHRHSDYFEAQTAIEYEQYQFQSSGHRTEALNLQALIDTTDTAFITRKLRQACFALSHQAVYKATYQLGLLDAVVQHLHRAPALLELPAVALYYYCYRLLTEPDEEQHFSQFKTLLFAQSALPPDEQRNLHLLAINYCVKKINQAQSRYFREVFDLYRSALQAGLLIENGVLSPFAYNNIVAIALKVHESAWAETFIHEYTPYLEAKHRESNVQLNLARVAYDRKHYGQALTHLQSADYKDLINNLISKTLLLKIFYETGEFDALDAHLQSMQSFLRRQRVIGYHRDNFSNIIRLTRKLMLHNPKSRSEVSALQQQIETETPLTEKEWLLDMLALRRR